MLMHVYTLITFNFSDLIISTSKSMNAPLPFDARTKQKQGSMDNGSVDVSKVFVDFRFIVITLAEIYLTAKVCSH